MLALCIVATVILGLFSFCEFSTRISEDPEYFVPMAIMHLGPAALAIVTIWVLYSKI